MYLKALEMQGFKSFPDKTVLTFENGITGVVGPNGSGKSNIADAVRWVLGEQSTKSLRGAKMEDVIFSGTKDRRAVGFAEVTLRLDNADGLLQHPEKEVCVTRRYYRSGDSAYLINDKSVRLRDVNELFMDTGLGRDGYSMVGQGKIEELVSAKSDNRRDMFEEASGISHYRYRRADALKRLSQTEENLVRLRDIVGELAARVGPLEKQSKKAQQFLVFAAERKELEIGLWLHTLERSAAQIREQAAKIDVARSQYDAVERTLAELSAAIDDAATATRDINTSIETLRAGNTATEEEAASLEQVAAVYETSVSHHEETAARLSESIAEQEADAAELEAQRAELEARIAALETETAAAAEEARRLSEKLGSLSHEDAAFSSDYTAANEALSALILKISQVQIMHSASASSGEQLMARIAQIDEQASALQTERETLETKAEKETAAATAAEERLTAMRNTAEGFAMRVRRAEERAQTAKDAFEEKKLLLMQKQSRLRFLEDTEKNMEGYGGSVKTVMRERARGTLTGVRGTLFQLIRVPEQYQTAVETALGGAIQDIVTETENDAKRAIRMLREKNAGRATFLPMTAIRGRTLEEKGLDDMFGFVNIAADLVETEPQYGEIVRSLLGRIAVCEDLDCAVTIAKKYNYRFKIVTLDGQVINAGGSMTGGSKLNNAGFLQRRTEIETLGKEIERIQTEIHAAGAAYKEAAERLSREKADGDGTQAQIVRLTEAKGEAQQKLSVTKAALERCRDAAAALETERAENEKKRAYYAENMTVAARELETLERDRQARETALGELSGGRDALAARREAINAEINDNNLRTLSLIKEQQAKKEQIETIERRETELRARRTALEAEKRENEEKSAALRENAAATRNEAARLREKIAENTAAVEALLKDRAAAEKRSVETREAEKSKTEERERLGTELVRLEERKNFLQHEQETTEKKLFDEYALTKREAAALAPEIASVPQAQKRLSELKGQIKALGSVNVGAIDEYKEVSSRYEFLSGQVNDVEKSKKELLRMIEELTGEMAERFRDRFAAINTYFSETFTQLFGGGTAQLVLEDENDILECGIDIKAQPPGKNVKSLSLLSGGEKGLIGIALLFAILKVRPAPFCIFDEVEAALDDVNVVRYAQFVRMMTDRTQFILITHRRGTMEEADMLYGVTMQEHGVSKLLELKTAEMAAQLKLEE